MKKSAIRAVATGRDVVRVSTASFSIALRARLPPLQMSKHSRNPSVVAVVERRRVFYGPWSGAARQAILLPGVSVRGLDPIRTVGFLHPTLDFSPSFPGLLSL